MISKANKRPQNVFFSFMGETDRKTRRYIQWSDGPDSCRGPPEILKLNFIFLAIVNECDQLVDTVGH